MVFLPSSSGNFHNTQAGSPTAIATIARPSVMFSSIQFIVIDARSVLAGAVSPPAMNIADEPVREGTGS
ncbi:MAG TPA: hypothetical protein VK662_09365 [Acidothermaceae bacterium]|nr:hypothetical protein [Acidothermaceae bacterium]